MSNLDYRYRGARALVLLHETHLRDFVATWRRAQAAHIRLPKTPDPSYASLEHLLVHVLAAARSYMTWTCEKLELPAPGIRSAPEAASITAQLDSYLDHVLAQWRAPLADVDEAAFEPQTYVSRWGVPYCIDSMLEHAVMHPLRHSFQLQELLADATAR